MSPVHLTDQAANMGVQGQSIEQSLGSKFSGEAPALSMSNGGVNNSMELRNSGMSIVQGVLPAGIYLDPNSVAHQ